MRAINLGGVPRSRVRRKTKKKAPVLELGGLKSLGPITLSGWFDSSAILPGPITYHGVTVTTTGDIGGGAAAATTTTVAAPDDIVLSPVDVQASSLQIVHEQSSYDSTAMGDMAPQYVTGPTRSTFRMRVFLANVAHLLSGVIRLDVGGMRLRGRVRSAQTTVAIGSLQQTELEGEVVSFTQL